MFGLLLTQTQALSWQEGGGDVCGKEKKMCVEMEKKHFYKLSFKKNYTEHFLNITID